MNERIVNVCGISKSFGGRRVADKLSLSVAPGEVLCYSFPEQPFRMNSFLRGCRQLLM